MNVNSIASPIPPILCTDLCVKRQGESRQGRFAGLAKLFSLPGKIQILFLGKLALSEFKTFLPVRHP